MWITHGSKKKSQEKLKYIELNVNENTTYQNVWDATRAVLRMKFTALNAYIGKEGRSKVKNLSLCFSKLEKDEQCIHEASKRKQ